MDSTLIEDILSQFKLDPNGDHGIKHWKRVERIGLYLAENQNADIKVIQLFAFLHDSQRENEVNDPEHGLRAARFAQRLYNLKKLSIQLDQLNKLIYACNHHSNKYAKSHDLTIQICWDSDRLDLVRLDIEPDKLYLYTPKAKELDSFLFALQLLKKNRFK